MSYMSSKPPTVIINTALLLLHIPIVAITLTPVTVTRLDLLLRLRTFNSLRQLLRHIPRSNPSIRIKHDTAQPPGLPTTLLLRLHPDGESLAPLISLNAHKEQHRLHQHNPPLP